MPTLEQKKRLLKAKIAVALHDGRTPKSEEIDQVFLLTRVMYKAVPWPPFQTEGTEREGTAGDFLIRFL